jgi:hypothetical protein
MTTQLTKRFFIPKMKGNINPYNIPRETNEEIES